jgi:xylose isomerase
MSSFDPTPADKFSFGLWTVGNIGRDPFGDPTRPVLDPDDSVRKLGEIGAWGVNLHDNDLIPYGSSATERDSIVASFQKACADSGVVVPMCTTNLFGHPVFKDGAYTSNDPKVRAFAIQKTMAGIDLAEELGAEIYVFWGGREGTEADACRDPQEAVKRMREAMNYLTSYVKDQGYKMTFALEAKPNEPRSDIYLSTTGHMLHFITTLDDADMVGVNPEVAHENMAGLSFVHGVAQAMEAGKLAHIDLNAQKGPRYDQDLRFGSEGLKEAFLLVRLLEGTAGTARYEGPRHFDAHAYRTEDQAGVWDFARGCMRTYNVLKARAKAFDADPEVKAIIADQSCATADPLLGAYTSEKAAELSATSFDVDGIAKRGLRYEHLDQLMIEHLLGARS